MSNHRKSKDKAIAQSIHYQGAVLIPRWSLSRWPSCDPETDTGNVGPSR